jgi:hypothetical protein
VADQTDILLEVSDPLTGHRDAARVGPTGYVVVCGAERHVTGDVEHDDGSRTITLSAPALRAESHDA